MRPVTAFLRAIALTVGLAAVACFGAPPQPAAPRAARPWRLCRRAGRARRRNRLFLPRARSPAALGGGPRAQRRTPTSSSRPCRPIPSSPPPSAPRGPAIRARLARADLLLTRAFVEQVRERRRPPERGRMRYIDAGLAPRPASERDTLYALAAAPSLAGHVRSALRRNPAYDGLRRGLAAYRARWSRLPQIQVSAGRADLLRQRLGAVDPARIPGVHGLPVTGRADARHHRRPQPRRRLLRAADPRQYRARPRHPRRARRPLRPGRHRLGAPVHGRGRPDPRFDAGDRRQARHADARNGRPDPLCGAQPLLEPAAGPDPQARPRGAARPGAIAAERLQVLSDWSPQARVLQPRQVNWARGRGRPPPSSTCASCRARRT